MIEWNPVEGLEEILHSELKPGDIVVQKSGTRGKPYYSQITVSHPDNVGCLDSYYLLERPTMKEPKRLGAVVTLRHHIYGDVLELIRIGTVATVYEKPWRLVGNGTNENTYAEEWTWEQIVKLSAPGSLEESEL